VPLDWKGGTRSKGRQLLMAERGLGKHMAKTQLESPNPENPNDVAQLTLGRWWPMSLHRLPDGACSN